MGKGKAKKRMLNGKAEKQVCSSNWAGLHDDLLDLILDKLDYLLDIVRFSLVCKPWNSMASIHKQKVKPLLNHRPPWLLINNFPQNRKKRNQSLYNITNGSEILDNKFKLCIPYEYEQKNWYGSSYGWLLFKEVRNSVIILFNPLSGSIIHLPPITFSDTLKPYVKFIILSNDPYLGSFEVLATYPIPGRYIVAHLRFGNESWTYSEPISICFCSFAFYKSCILGVSRSGRIWSLDLIHSSNGSSSIIKFKEEIGDLNMDRYSLSKLSTFVETTNGDLLMVQKYLPPTPTFKIFKIIGLNIGQFVIIPVEKLDCHSLFLERYSYHPYQQCISVLASNFAVCRANSIYYSNRHFKLEGKECILKHTIKVYNLDDQSLLTNEHSFPISNIGLSGIHSAFWLVPSIKHTSRMN